MGRMTTAAQQWAHETEQALLDHMLRLAPAQGWTRRTLAQAGQALGMSEGETGLLVPHGPADLAALLSRRHDQRALAALGDPHNMKIRDRIRRAVEARLDAAIQDEAAVRRWMGFMALPMQAPLASRLAWETADALWRWAGDEATDENHYTKRVILSGIVSGALAIWLVSGRGAALAFVDRRIDNVMAFEKWKATTKVRPSEWVSALAHTLGRARYGD